ncbi:MAG: hypothetical protein II828_05520 [Clostridia bacterium]|nr:hypothetical protein [Clostridia bacterium]
MRKYHMSGVEHIHMMRRVPRSYDMTRTHIMHRGVNRHVDVVLRCAPKHFKKKKVPVSIVRNEKKAEVARIRVGARLGYVAVRKSTNEAYEKDRRKVVRAYEITYGKPSATGKILIHDMKSQLATMAKRSADYIDERLPAGPTVTVATQAAAVRHDGLKQPPVPPKQQEAPLPPFPDVPDASAPSAATLSPEVDEILKKGGYKRPRQTPENPYASDYLKQASHYEFRSLMDSLEHSLDETRRRYTVPPVPEPTQADTQPAFAPLETPIGRETPPPEPSDDRFVPPEQPFTYDAPLPEDDGAFRPALDFSTGGQHYEPYQPEDDLFDRSFDGEEPVQPWEESSQLWEEPVQERQERQEGQEEEEGGFDVSRYFSDEEFDTPSAPASYPDEEDDDEPWRLSGEYYSENGEEEPYVPPTELFTNDGEEAYDMPPVDDVSKNGEEPYAPPTEFFTNDSEEAYDVPSVENFSDGDDEPAPTETYSAEEDEDAPMPMLFPDEDEDAPMPTVFPDEEDTLPPAYPQDSMGYHPAPVSPDNDEFWQDGEYATRVETDNTRPAETFYSRTGGQIRKAIGVIRGSQPNAGANDGGQWNIPPTAPGGDVEITFSDHRDG